MDLKPHGKLTQTLRVLLKITIAVTAIAVVAGFYDFYSYSTLWFSSFWQSSPVSRFFGGYIGVRRTFARCPGKQ
jgi:hypothetical protein